MVAPAAIKPRRSERLNKKRKADDADVDTHADSKRLKGPIKIVEVAPGGDVLIKVRRPGWKNERDKVHNSNSGGGLHETRTGKAQKARGNSKAKDGNDLDDDQAIDILVSSEVLSSGSSMFKVMLQGRYLEAQTKIIEVEDNPTIFLNFCEVLHGVFDNKTPIDTTWFREFLRIVDMRDAARAVEHWVTDRLGGYFERIKTFEIRPWSQRQHSQNSLFHRIPNGVHQMEVEDVMMIAAFFRFEHLFWKAFIMCLTTFRLGGDKASEATNIGIWEGYPTSIRAEKLRGKSILGLKYLDSLLT